MSTTIVKGNVIEIKGPNLSADWTMSNTEFSGLPAGIPINYMMYTPGASRDVCAVRFDDGSASPNQMPMAIKFECANSWDQKIVYFHGRRFRPRVDKSSGSKGKTSNSKLSIVFD